MTQIDVSEDRFSEMAGEAWDAVPPEWRGKIENVALLIEDEPSEAVRKEEGLTGRETLLGRYHGIPESERGEGYGVGPTLPDTITLYRLPLLEEAAFLREERSFATPEDAVREAVRETLWHEIGHYFGLHEEEVNIRERGGTNRFGP